MVNEFRRGSRWSDKERAQAQTNAGRMRENIQGCTVVMGVVDSRPSSAQLTRLAAYYVRDLACNRCMGAVRSRRRRYHHPRSPSPAAPRSFPTPSHTMALRLAVARPLGAAARSMSCSRAAVRTFAATALRAKEIAGESKDTPNMRVRWITVPGLIQSSDNMRSMLPATPRASSRPPS